MPSATPIAGWLAVAIVSSCVTSAFAEPCTLHEVASLPVSFNSEGGIVVPVDLGDGKTRSFLVDTGSRQSFVLAHLADELKLGTHNAPTNPPYYLRGVHIGYRIRIPAVKLDQATVTDVYADLIPAVQWSPEDGTDGILGNDILSLYDIEFDLTEGKLNLFSQGSCPTPGAYWSHQYAKAPIRKDGAMFFFSITLDGKSVETSLHTTGATTSISPFTAHSIGLTPVQMTNGPDQPSTYGLPIQKLSIGALTMLNPQVNLVDVALDEWRVAHAQDNGMVGFMMEGPSVGQEEIRTYGTVRNVDEIHSITAPQPLKFVAFGTRNIARLRMFVSFSDDFVYVTSAHAQ